jgi:hypothetical protein
MSTSTNATAATHPRDLLQRARQILNAANGEHRDLNDIETGRVDEILDIVSLAIDRRRSRSRNHRRMDVEVA